MKIGLNYDNMEKNFWRMSCAIVGLSAAATLGGLGLLGGGLYILGRYLEVF